MNRLSPLQAVTRELSSLLEKKIPASGREEVIEEAARLLNQRERLINEISPPFNPVEQAAGKELVALNEAVQKKMDHLFETIKSDIRAVKQKKKSNGKYINPYQETASLDGRFLDHKK